MTHPHGTRGRYRQSCRCLPCRAANATYVQARRSAVLYPDPAELVDAVYAVMHLMRLRTQGVGYRQAARLAGVSERLIADVRAGRLLKVRADTLTRIYSVQPILAHGQTVMGWRTWRLLDSLEREGFERQELARRLGHASPRLQIQRKRLRVRTALKVRVLYGRINNVPDEGDHAVAG